MFKVLFLLSTVLVAALAVPTAGSDDVIRFGVVGGSDAKNGEFPYMASLRKQTNDHHICGGSILTHHSILTSAECVSGYSPSDLYVVVGSVHLNSGGTKYSLVNITIHSKYNSTTYENNIALLNTTKAMTFNDNVDSIRRSTSETGAGVDVVLTGWGKTSSDDSGPHNTLQKLTYDTITNKDCKKKMGDNQHTINKTNLCAYKDVGKGACDGDAGSPLVTNNDDSLLVGFFSFGKGCAKGHPDVYTRVSSYDSWIKNHTKS